MNRFTKTNQLIKVQHFGLKAKVLDLVLITIRFGVDDKIIYRWLDGWDDKYIPILILLDH